MTEAKKILEELKRGRISTDEALLYFQKQPYEDIGFAKVDMKRSLIQGNGEVIYGAGKSAEQILSIIKTMQKNGQERILITRLSDEKASGLQDVEGFIYHAEAGIGTLGQKKDPDGLGRIAVVSAGTSDLAVSEEAALTSEFFGNETVRIYDAGVAGLHRLLSNLDELMSASVVIAVAGMEGALASVVGGLVSAPVIAVPTSVGYGASFGGVSALLSMLNSCASGVSVVNIDNGFGAAYQASLINHMEKRSEK
ncbi:MAG: nickel pincer cofactor biosynthesis protein LarB [Lachnospiraceae bacterium]|nr:nickel pincer cofactor biosynthesis protein LarB [Lachnospiraceae bacterium]